MKTLEDLKKELNEETLYVDYDEPDYDYRNGDVAYPIYYDGGNEIEGLTKEFSGYVEINGEVEEQN